AYHVIFWRSISGFIVFSFFLLRSGNTKKTLLPKMTKSKILWIIGRGIVSAVSAIFLFTAVSVADMSEVGSLVNINPIFAVFFGWLLIREQVNWKIIFAVILAITGVFLVRNPFITGLSLGHLLVFFAAIFISLDFVFMRKCSLLGFHTIIIVFSMLIAGLVISVPVVLSQGIMFPPPVMFLVVGAGTLDMVTQLFLTRAAKYLASGVISIITLASVFEFMLWGYLFFNESVTLVNIVGAICIVIASGATIILRVRKKPKVKEQSA
ncbi:MAG: DMT family transporter, partial [Spirochaetia bacterium]